MQKNWRAALSSCHSKKLCCTQVEQKVVGRQRNLGLDQGQLNMPQALVSINDNGKVNQPCNVRECGYLFQPCLHFNCIHLLKNILLYYFSGCTLFASSYTQLSRYIVNCMRIRSIPNDTLDNKHILVY